MSEKPVRRRQKNPPALVPALVQELAPHLPDSPGKILFIAVPTTYVKAVHEVMKWNPSKGPTSPTFEMIPGSSAILVTAALKCEHLFTTPKVYFLDDPWTISKVPPRLLLTRERGWVPDDVELSSWGVNRMDPRAMTWGDIARLLGRGDYPNPIGEYLRQYTTYATNPYRTADQTDQMVFARKILDAAGITDLVEPVPQGALPS